MRDEMREPAKIVSEILLEIASHVRPGISTFVLDCLAQQEMKKRGVYSYDKGYHPSWAREPYPAYICTCVNDVLAHGLPNENPLREGDTVIIDVGIIDKNGNCADSALTVPVGSIDEKTQQLIDYAKKTTYAAIKIIKDGVSVGQLAQAMENKAGERNFVINRQMCSHAIGKEMHMEPLMYNVGNKHAANTKEKFLEYQKYMDIELKEGMVVCMEPILTYTDPWGWINPTTGWEVRTKDKKKAAMFEHMILVKKDGCEVLTNHFTLPDYSR